MNPVYIYESKMKFGPFAEDEVIPIEKTPQYIKIQHGMRMCEFVLCRKGKRKLIYVEAKTTAPNPNSKDVINPKEKFQNYIIEIKEKFTNALDLYVNMAMKKEVPNEFEDIDYNEYEIIFLLVIKECDRQWVKDVKDALEMSVRSELRVKNIWCCKVLVFNEEMALRQRLIEENLDI